MKKASAVVEKYPQLTFFILLIVAYWCGFVWEAIPKHPQSLHISAQCDRASIALNFYQEEMNILVPHIHNRSRGTGIAAAELPIIQYAVACIYKVAGFNDSYYRLFVMLLFSIGFFFVWKISVFVSKNYITALLVSFLWLSSPTLLYYVPNFNQEQISQLENSGRLDLAVDGEVFILSLEDVEILSSDIPGYKVANEGKVTVALDVNISSELKSEGIAREVVNRLQNLRKDLGFEVTDRISVEIKSHDFLNDAINSHKSYICTQILAETLTISDSVSGGVSIEVEDITTDVKLLII